MRLQVDASENTGKQREHRLQTMHVTSMGNENDLIKNPRSRATLLPKNSNPIKPSNKFHDEQRDVLSRSNSPYEAEDCMLESEGYTVPR